MSGAIVVGTAGWTYAYFRRSLRRYAECFDGVEVDSSFYAIPSSRVVARWTQLTPRHFTFDVKLHRLLSRHAAPLSSLPVDLRAGAQTAESGRVMLDRSLEQALCSRTLAAMEPLRTSGKLSSFLLQLTPAFKPREHQLIELEPLLNCLAPVPVAVELRHREWLRDLETTLGWFRAARAVFVSVDAPDVKAPHVLPKTDAVTRDDLAYLRAHGRNADGYLRGRTAAERFDWRYSEDELSEITARARSLATTAAEVRLMFGNGMHAPTAALRARDILVDDAVGAALRGARCEGPS